MTDTPMRTTSLRQILVEHRREMLAGVRSRLRNGRIDPPAEARDLADDSDAQVQGDIELALLQMRAQTLTRIDEALGQLAAGTYGVCSDCEGEISERRLRALPFAVRCQACEARREHLHLRARQRTEQDAGLWGLRSAAS